MGLVRLTSTSENRFLVAFVLLVLLSTESAYGQTPPTDTSQPLPTDITCFPCNDGPCIPTFLICDGFPHCFGGEDEDGCSIDTCEPSDFVCNDGTCIPQSWICDGIIDCSESEDELFCPGNTCQPSDFVCNDGTCIPQFAVCDGFPTCIGSEDELFCNSTCEPSEFVCNDGTCLPQFFVCDGYPICPEGEDELFCPSDTCASFEFECFFDGTCVPQIYICDDIQNCPGGEDEIICPPPCGPSEVMCTAGLCLSNDTLCNGIPECPNGNDELGCPGSCSGPTFLNISGSIISSPNFPAPNNQQTICSFTARAPEGQVVVVIFNAFDSHDPDLGCLFQLSIFDQVAGPLLEPSCRSSIPPPVVSVTNIVRLIYSSSGQEFRQGKGFEASVKFVNKSDLEELQCDDSVFFSEDYLTSPGFPELYQNN